MRSESADCSNMVYQLWCNKQVLTSTLLTSCLPDGGDGVFVGSRCICALDDVDGWEGDTKERRRDERDA